MAERQWETQAVPILEAVAAAEDEGRRPNLDQLVEATGLDRDVAAREVRSLIVDDYLDGLDASSMGGPDYLELQPRRRPPCPRRGGDGVTAAEIAARGG